MSSKSFCSYYSRHDFSLCCEETTDDTNKESADDARKENSVRSIIIVGIHLPLGGVGFSLV